VNDVSVRSRGAWIAVLVAIALPGERRRAPRTAREGGRFDHDEPRWMGGRRPGPQGCLHPRQKLNAARTATFTALFLVSGLLLWPRERAARHRHPKRRPE
jgi:hypothetical protein